MDCSGSGIRSLLAILPAVVALSAVPAAADVPQGYFTDVVQVAGLDSPHQDVSPHATPGGLTLYFASVDRPGAPGKDDLYRATRASTDDPFSNVSQLPLDTPHVDGSPSVSPDGLTLYFYSDRPGGQGGLDVWTASRASTSLPFSNPSNLGSAVNSSSDDRGPGVAADGLTVFYTSNRPGTLGEADLWMATRATTGDPFGNAANLGSAPNSSAKDRAPGVSADGLTLFFFSDRAGGEGKHDIWVATRASTSDPFGAAVNLDVLWPGSTVNGSGWEVTPDISPEWPAAGSKLYFTVIISASDYDIYQATWVPKADPVPVLSGLSFAGTVVLMLSAGAWIVHRRAREASTGRAAPACTSSKNFGLGAS